MSRILSLWLQSPGYVRETATLQSGTVLHENRQVLLCQCQCQCQCQSKIFSVAKIAKLLRSLRGRSVIKALCQDKTLNIMQQKDTRLVKKTVTIS